MVKIVDATTLDTWLKSGECILIDVREADEYAAAHIRGANLCPLSTFHQGFKLETYPQHKKIVFQCRSGKRSDTACHIAIELYPDQQDSMYNLEGGIIAWTANGLPTESPDA